MIKAELTTLEKRIIKSLLQQGKTNQDIQYLINIGRKKTVNPARIAEVKKSNTVISATPQEIEKFLLQKKTHNWETGLNLVDDERLIKSREAMYLAVNVFNTPYIKFKAEAFTVYANIAWTYLVHQYCIRQKINIEKKNGETLPLSHLLKNLPLTTGVKKNLEAIKEIRDTVEHRKQALQI